MIAPNSLPVRAAGDHPRLLPPLERPTRTALAWSCTARCHQHRQHRCDPGTRRRRSPPRCRTCRSRLARLTPETSCRVLQPLLSLRSFCVGRSGCLPLRCPRLSNPVANELLQCKQRENGPALCKLDTNLRCHRHRHGRALTCNCRRQELSAYPASWRAGPMLRSPSYSSR